MEDLENFDTTIQASSLDDLASKPYTKDFTKETLLGRLELEEVDLR